MENSSQFLKLDEQHMLNLWKTIMHFEPTRLDCVIERKDGIDIDALLTIHINQWYAHLLETAPVQWLPVVDVKTQVALSIDKEGVVTATIPQQCVRPIEWQLNGWQQSVTSFLQPDSHEAANQHCMWTRGNSHTPAAIDCGDTLKLFSGKAGNTPTLLKARCVVRPGNGLYQFHAVALATIPNWEHEHLSII